jgi:hemerythrin-like domain-containing protein
MRYQFYREHKYVSSALNEVERLIAKTDFSNDIDIKKVEEAFQGLSDMLKGHAYYENEKLHALLKAKGSHVFETLEKDHAHQDQELLDIQKTIHDLYISKNPEKDGYNLYLLFREFVAENLHHLNQEERLILPELQRLYTDEELKQVEMTTYQIMTVEDLIEMMQVLFPHMNKYDKKAFLEDIKEASRDKYETAIKGVQNVL